MTRRFRTGLLLLLALGVPSLTWGQAYQIVDMGVGPPYLPTALNNRGQVLFTNDRLTPARIGLFLASAPFLPRWSGAASLLWDNGHTSTIGVLPGGTYSRGCGLNDAGQVAGFGDEMTPYSTCLDEPSRAIHAFIWGGGAADLDPGVKVTLEDGSECQVFIIPSLALGINNQGQVTGWLGSQLPSGDYNHGFLHAFRTAGGQIDHDADDLTPGEATITQGYFINNAGAVLGTRLGGGYAFFGGGGGLPPAGAVVHGMNDRGTTVGDVGFKGYAWGGIGELPSPFEGAFGINNHDQIVGLGSVGDQYHALLYSDGDVIDLNDSLPAGSGWELLQALAINDNGQIVIEGNHKGQLTFGLLTPVQMSLTLSDKEISSDDSATGTVTLSLPAPAGGTIVTLKAEAARDQSQLSVPDAVVVPEGETRVTFPIASKPNQIWQDDTVYTIKASIGGPGQSQELMVHPTIHNLYVAVDPQFGTKGGGISMGTITLSLPAPAGGRAVMVSSSSPAVAAINGSAAGQTRLVVPAGQTELELLIDTQAVTAPAEVEITAQTPTSEQTRAFRVVP